MTTSVDDRLKQLRSWRDEMQQALVSKIDQLRSEREECQQQYDEEIAKLEDELKSLGIAVMSERPSDIAIKAYNWLLEHPGYHNSGEIMCAIRCVGAMASVVLRPLIDAGKIVTAGGSRTTRYAAAPGCISPEGNALEDGTPSLS